MAGLEAGAGAATVAGYLFGSDGNGAAGSVAPLTRAFLSGG